MRVHDRDISVVVQGPVVGSLSDNPPRRQLTRICLTSIRRHLPQAEVILSTWRGSDVRGLSYDSVIFNEDPGGSEFPYQGSVLPYNVNRQIVSTREGLRRSTRPFALKIRSDMALHGTRFLNFFGKFTHRHPDWKIFQERVVTLTPPAWERHGRVRAIFFPNDWCFFGLREDLLTLWDVPLAPEPETSQWFSTRSYPECALFVSYRARYNVEQYIWLSCLRKLSTVACDHHSDYSPATHDISQLSFANNFIMIRPRMFPVTFMKYRRPIESWPASATYGEWLRIYRRYCEPSLGVPPDVEYHAKLTWERVAPHLLRAARRIPVIHPRVRRWYVEYLRGAR